MVGGGWYNKTVDLLHINSLKTGEIQCSNEFCVYNDYIFSSHQQLF